MNRFLNILALTFSLATLWIGCAQEDAIKFEKGDEEIEIQIPQEGYIFFNASMQKNTRGTVIRRELHEDFSVLGYRYPSQWSSEAPQARQDKKILYTDDSGQLTSNNYMGVFHPKGNDNPPSQQTITWKGTFHEYSPLQEWQKNLKYAFFAWYPSTLKANGGNDSYEGLPFITYNLPLGTGRDARMNMYDVLTANEVGYTKSNGLSVDLQMVHRLVALDIKAASLINAKALKDTYGDNKTTNYISAWDESTLDNSEPVYLKVDDIKLTLNKIKTSARIELNPTFVGKSLTATGELTPTYVDFAGADRIGYLTTEDDIHSLVGNDEKLILIPQEDPINVTIELDYHITCNGHTKDFDDVKVEGVKINKLSENTYNYLLINFTKSGLFVKALSNDVWEDVNVKHEFE